MRRVTALSAVLLLAMGGGTARGQACGDFDGVNGLSISDYTRYVQFLCFKDGTAPVGNWSRLDVDHREGITMGDMTEFHSWLFNLTPPNLTCNITGQYSLTLSLTDTVFFPRMLAIPDGIDKLQLPVRTNFGSGVRAAYLPFVKVGPADNGLFHLTAAPLAPDIQFSFSPMGSYAAAWDTLVSYAAGILTSIAGPRTLLTLEYTRNAPGTGSVAPLLVDRNEQWKPTVDRDGDLFLPVIQYYDFVFPPETLKVSIGSMAFDAVAGYPSADSFVVSFTSSGLPISFELTPDDPWVTIVDTGAVGFRTPCSVIFKATAAATGVGDYTTQIHFTNLSPSAPTTIAAIDATMHVRAPNIYPFGDLDCDGIVDISDMTKIIDYLYISMAPLVPCQP